MQHLRLQQTFEEIICHSQNCGKHFKDRAEAKERSLSQNLLVFRPLEECEEGVQEGYQGRATALGPLNCLLTHHISCLGTLAWSYHNEKGKGSACQATAKLEALA